MKKSAIAIAIILFCASAVAGDMPNPVLTPGAVLTSDLATLCAIGYTKTVRNVPDSEKLAVYKEYGMADSHSGECADGCEVDHLISLQLGGSNDIKNLWPEPYAGKWGAHKKDVVENKLHAMMCDKQITVEEAQRLIVTDWKSVYLKYYGDPML